jgi:predicted transcriptional regulator
MTRDDTLNVRIPSDLKAALQRLADAGQRKLSDYVVLALRQRVDKGEKRKERKS